MYNFNLQFIFHRQRCCQLASRYDILLSSHYVENHFCLCSTTTNKCNSVNRCVHVWIDAINKQKTQLNTHNEYQSERWISRWKWTWDLLTVTKLVYFYWAFLDLIFSLFLCFISMFNHLKVNWLWIESVDQLFWNIFFVPVFKKWRETVKKIILFRMMFSNPVEKT